MTPAVVRRAEGWASDRLAALQRALYGPGAPARLTWPGAAETAAVALALAAVIALVYLPHLRHGGLMSDDWSNLAEYRAAPAPQVLEAAGDLFAKLGGRPLLAVLLVLPAAAFGDDPTGWIAVSLALNAVAAFALYVTLRALGLRAPYALAPVLLSLVFAASSSIRLWVAAGINQVAVIALLAGLLCTLSAFGARGRRGPALHVAGMALYVVSIAVYEAGAIVLLLLGPVYLRVAQPRDAARRWAADVAVLVPLLLLSVARTRGSRGLDGPLDILLDAPRFGYQALRVLAGVALTPFGIPGELAILPFLAAALVVAVVRPSREDLVRAGVLRWAAAAAACVALLAVLVTAFLPSGLGPASEGLENRANLMAGPVFCALALSLLGGCAALASLALPPHRRRGAVTAAMAGAVAFLFAGGVVAARDEQRTWRSAAERQLAVVRALRATMPPQPAGTTAYVTGFRTSLPGRVPVFEEIWDLWGAAQLAYADPTLNTYAMRPQTRLVCGPDGVVAADPVRPNYLEETGSRYRRAIAVDVSTGSTVAIDDRTSCDAAAALIADGGGRAS